MDKVTLTTVTSGYYDADAINANFQALVTAINNTISRDGTTPNTMSADLDLNGNYLLNQAADPTGDTFTFEGDWATATDYSNNDIVYVTVATDGTNGGASYICRVSHTSGTFATDLAANKWSKIAARGATGAGSGDMLAANNLSEVTAATALTNLGIGNHNNLTVDGSGNVSVSGTLTVTGLTTGVIPVGTVTFYAGATAPSGWLLLNGDTIGNAASGATHAGAAYEPLFDLLYAQMANSEAPVTNRSGTAQTDWDAGEVMTLPDATGRALFGKEATATRLTTAGNGDLDGATLGDTGGSQSHTLTETQMPAHTHGISDAGVIPYAGGSSYRAATAASVQSTSTGGGQPHNNVPPGMILSVIIKY